MGSINILTINYYLIILWALNIFPFVSLSIFFFFTTVLYFSVYMPYTCFSSVQFSSVAQSCPTFCNPMDCSMPGLPVHQQLLGFTQTHVQWVSDAIQPSHPLSSPFFPSSIIPSIERLLLNHANTPGFLAPGGEEFNPGPETRLDRSELLCNTVLWKYKGDRESFWHRHQKGAERVPPC